MRQRTLVRRLDDLGIYLIEIPKSSSRRLAVRYLGERMPERRDRTGVDRRAQRAFARPARGSREAPLLCHTKLNREPHLAARAASVWRVSLLMERAQG